MQKFKEFENISRKYFKRRVYLRRNEPSILGRVFQLVKENFNIEDKIVDAGCGSNMFKSVFPNLVGFDIVDYGNQNFTSSIFDADIEKESQDGVLCLGVLHECPEEYHLPNIEKLLSWIRPGGKLIMRCKEKPVAKKHLLTGKTGHIMTDYLNKGLWNVDKINQVGKHFNLTLEWKERVIRTRIETWKGDSPFDKEHDNDIIFEGNIWCWRKDV